MSNVVVLNARRPQADVRVADARLKTVLQDLRGELVALQELLGVAQNLPDCVTHLPAVNTALDELATALAVHAKGNRPG